MMSRTAAPDRWLKYSPIGEKIKGTRFIAFKVPLKEGICRKLPSEKRFTPQMLIEKVPALGLIIDLTNTNRYYNPQEFPNGRVQYKKIYCQGHAIPSDAVTDQFFRTVDAFLASNKDVDVLIGVHCTHGLNRTGYLICKYMIKKLGFAPDAAISAFEVARGYPIERDLYLQDLRDTDGRCTEMKSEAVCENSYMPNRAGAASHHPSKACRGNSWRSRCRTADYCDEHASSSRDPVSRCYDDTSYSWSTSLERENAEMSLPNRGYERYRQDTNSLGYFGWDKGNEQFRGGRPCYHSQERFFYSGRRQSDSRNSSCNPRCPDIYPTRYTPY